LRGVGEGVQAMGVVVSSPHRVLGGLTIVRVWPWWFKRWVFGLVCAGGGGAAGAQGGCGGAE
jgi:hypothetical protein